MNVIVGLSLANVLATETVRSYVTRRYVSVPVCASVFVRNHLRKAAVAAGAKIPDGYRFGLHNLRHSLSNWLVNSGTDVKTVQTMLRHSKSQTTLDLYPQGDNDNKISAQERFCGLIVDQEAARKTPQVRQ